MLRVATVVVAFLGIHLTASSSVQAAPSIPYKINFQGRLTNNDGNIVPNGLYNIRFTIYDAASGGTQLWQESRQVASRVQITNGLFDVRFGDVTPLTPALFNNASQLYLEVELPSPATATCATAACASYTEGPLSPRQPIAASPYAFNADTVDGIDGSQLARVDQANTFSGNQTISGSLTATTLLQGANQVCDVSNNCSYALAAGAAGYIQNQTATPQVASFSISGNGTIGGALLIQGGISSLGAGAQSEVFGQGAIGAGSSVAVGYAAEAGSNGVAIGRGAIGNGSHVVIGRGATNTTGLGDSVTIGNMASGTTRCVTIGGAATSTGSYCVAIGVGAATAGSSVAVGSGAKAQASGGVAIGYSATSSHGSSIAVGRDATTNAAGQLVVGSSTNAVTQSYIGNGVTSASPVGLTLNATGGEGLDIQGGNLMLASGRGTGGAAGGSILFQTSAPGASGTALRSLVTRAQINGGTGTMSIGTTSDLGQLTVQSNLASRTGLILRAAPGQTADILQLQDNAGSSYLSVTSGGTLTVRPAVGASSIVVKDASGNNIFVINASGKIELGSGGAAFGAIKKITTNWDPPETANTTSSTTTFTLPVNAVVIGVSPPAAPACGGFGCTYASGGAILDSRGLQFAYTSNSASQRVSFVFTNSSGAAVNPPNAAWTIWYIEP